MKLSFLLSAIAIFYFLHNAHASTNEAFEKMNKMKFNITKITIELKHFSKKLTNLVTHRLEKYKKQTVRLSQDLARDNLHKLKVYVEKDMKNDTVGQECYQISENLIKQSIRNLPKNDDSCDLMDLELMHIMQRNVTTTVKSGSDLIDEFDNTTLNCCCSQRDQFTACVKDNFPKWKKEYLELEKNYEQCKNWGFLARKQSDRFHCFGNRINEFMNNNTAIIGATNECFDSKTFDSFKNLWSSSFKALGTTTKGHVKETQPALIID